MNPRLMQIMRNVERKHPPAEKTQPSGDLGSAIEALIEQRVQERVSAELDRHRDRLQPTGPRLRQMLNAPVPHTDFAQVPEPPKTPPPVDMTTLLHRDELGRTQWLEIGNLKFDIERDRRGRAVRMVQRTEK